MDDVQSWWEIPCIAHFCSLFRLYFDLIDFDIEELEEALLTDSVEEVGNSFLQELIVRLLKGCFNSQKDEITTCNYQMYLRRLFRKKCEEGSTKNNPFDKDAAFYSLPLRTKVEILYDLCDFRLDNEDVSESLKSLESDSLRVAPLGQDSGGSTYWYFYGTRLYREDYSSVSTTSTWKKKARKGKEDKVSSSWQVACFTEEDWQLLTRKFKNCKSSHEKNLHRTLRDDFLPELPRLFAEKERLQRKRMLEQQLRRSGRSIVSSTVVASASEGVKEAMPSGGSSKKSSSSPEDKGGGKDDSSLDDGDVEDALRRQREEQEKADRLLAEEMEREERKSRLHLRERRGGGASGSGLSSASSVTVTHKASSSRTKSSSSHRKESDSRSSSTKSPSKSPVKKEKKKKKKSAGGRTTNNSLAAKLPSKERSDGEQSANEEGEDAEISRVKVKKKKRKEEDVRSRSRSPSQTNISSSESPTRKSKKSSSGSSPSKSKKKKSSSGNEEDDGEEGGSKPNKEKSRDKKKHKVKKKEKSRDKSKGKERSKTKERRDLDDDHVGNIISVHSAGGMSKTKVKSSVIFSQSEEDVQIGMHKVIESIKNHGDAWPFLNPVDEDYAPNYYRVISCPMDLQTMEDKLDNHEYRSLDEFVADFQRIVDNCTKYNGPSNEYTEMVETLQEAFNKAIQRFIVPDESDEEISIEYATAEVERKRPRQSVKNTSHKDEAEHLKENAPCNSKKVAPLLKSKNHKFDKKKMKQKLMRHHSRDSEAIEKLTAAGAETLKDINKWLSDPPKHQKGSESESKKRKASDDESDKDVESKASAPQVGHKRKAEDHSSSKSSSSKSKHKLRDDEDNISDEFMPPKKMFKKSSKHGKNESQSSSSSKKDGSHKSESKSKKGSEKESKDREKDRHHYKHHKHRHSTESTNRDSSPKFNHKIHSSSEKSSEKHIESHQNNSEKLHKSVKELSAEKSVLKHSKSLEEKKSKAPVKRGNSLFSTLKNGSGSAKRVPSGNKPPKFSAFSLESKFKTGSDAHGNKGAPGDSQGVSRDNGLVADKPEKKKCLLLNDTSTDREGGPRLSLGSVLSTDAIKLGEFKKEETCSDDDYEASVSSSLNKLKSDGGSGADQKSKENETKASPKKTSKESENEAEKESEVEIDRKLEPSKGFNREKCMPNLSAWIKAFGGPVKPVGPVSTPIKKSDPETKSKFKVMGRGVGESSSTVGPHETPQPKPVLPKGSPIHKPAHKPLSEAPWNNINPVQNPLINPMKMQESTSEEMSAHNLSHHPSKKHRHRKMSTSSLSSQSESGSPHCFSGPDGTSVIGGSVVNPPRWADEHWTQSHSQSQSPSASSHVSSQSPANSPYSPAINSPPHTPQTPPRPLGPVRAGFYQDITSQHSSPEKINESHSNSNSNVASPSTPPTPTNASNSNRRDVSSNSSSGSKATYYPPPVYVPRYAASTPSPNVAPGSNLQSPSPGGMGSSVESPGNPNSPHSPNINPVATVADYRNTTYASQHQSTSSSSSIITTSSHPTPPAHQQQPTSHRGSVLNPHTGHSSPSIAPYPPPSSHYGHPSAINPAHSESSHGGSQPLQAHQPAMAHMNQVQAHSQMSHQQHYDRYSSHNLAHHSIQVSANSSIPSSSVASYSQNLTAAHSQSQRPSTAQPSPYPTNPYASNPRSINIPPNIYNNPISSDPAMNRFYKPTVSGGELSLTASSSISSGGGGEGGIPVSSHSRSRSSRSNTSSSADNELPRSASANLEGKFPHGELNGFQWPHNLASLSQIVNSIPNPMNAVGMANAYRQYDQAMAETINKYQRQEAAGYTNLSASAAANLSTAHSGKSSTPHPPAAHSHSLDKNSDSNSDVPVVSSRRQSSKSSESKSRSKGGSQSIVPGSAFNFSSLAPADLALYPKDMTDAGSLYSSSPPGLAHRPDLYPVSSSSFHPSFPTTARTTAGGVATPPITPYQIPPFIGSHPSPYQPQSVPSQAFAHSQPPRGLTVDTYQQFFQSSPHVMGLLPPTGYPYPHGLGFNRPGGWI